MHVGPDELSMWGDLGEKMIVLSAESDQHMKDLELMAKNLRLPCHMIDVKVHFYGVFLCIVPKLFTLFSIFTG